VKSFQDFAANLFVALPYPGPCFFLGIRVFPDRRSKIDGHESCIKQDSRAGRFHRFGIAPEGGAFVATRKKSNPMPKEKEEFAADELAAVDAIIQRHKGKQGALIPVLEEIQEAVGYLPKSIQSRVARRLKIPFSEVYGVVTFYSFFTMFPRGKHTVRCCLGTACYVRGGKKILETLTETLKVQPGETTPDRQFSLETVRCLGACGLAPVVVVDEDTHRQMKPSKITGVLGAYDK
jgi:NADH:ubiquinone oxidoreductase subunit E